MLLQAVTALLAGFRLQIDVITWSCWFGHVFTGTARVPLLHMGSQSPQTIPSFFAIRVAAESVVMSFVNEYSFVAGPVFMKVTCGCRLPQESRMPCNRLAMQ